VILGEVPALRLVEPGEEGASPTSEHVEMLIAALANIESPDFGLSPTVSGHSFVAIDGKQTPGAFPYADHHLEVSSSLQELVRIGPAALPALLGHLDDATPTKLTVRNGVDHGIMWFDREMWANPASDAEQRVLRGKPKVEHPPPGEGPRSHTVTVGDVCFVAIGQITGRGYQAVRYQPTACVVLNSPTQDPKLCELVRAVWHSDNPRQKLFDSLLLDYATRGRYDGDGLDSWGIGSELQVGAAMRLLFYYPQESLAMIVKRIDGLDVTEAEPWIERQVANGVSAEDFIAAVSWSQHPEVVAAVQRAVDRKQRSATADEGANRSRE